MRLSPFVAVTPLLLATGCSGGEDAGSPENAAAIALQDAAYSGELVLRADVALVAPGAAVTISIVAPGTERPLLSRSYDLHDPIWRPRRDEARIYFVLDARDAWPGVESGVALEMELVARFDPDGNPATDEPGSVRVRLPVRTGSRSILAEIVLAHPVAANAREHAYEPASDR